MSDRIWRGEGGVGRRVGVVGEGEGWVWCGRGVRRVGVVGEGEGWVWCGRGVRRVGVVEGTRKEMKGRVCGCVVGREEGDCGGRREKSVWWGGREGWEGGGRWQGGGGGRPRRKRRQYTYSSIMKNDNTAVPKIRKQPLYY